MYSILFLCVNKYTYPVTNCTALFHNKHVKGAWLSIQP